MVISNQEPALLPSPLLQPASGSPSWCCKLSAPGINTAQLGTVTTNQVGRNCWSCLQEQTLCLLHPPRRCISHHGRGEAVAVVGEESVEGWERANELLVAGRMFPSKLMCANA